MDEKIKKSLKGNIEIEGLVVPDETTIEKVITKYKDKLDDESLGSLLYTLNYEINKTKGFEKNDDKDRKCFRK